MIPPPACVSLRFNANDTPAWLRIPMLINMASVNKERIPIIHSKTLLIDIVVKLSMPCRCLIKLWSRYRAP